MKFLLDENFPRTALTQLQSAGHEASHALDFFPPGTSDEQLFARAQQEKSIFVSTDKDFFHTVPLTYEKHHGTLVITLRQPNREKLLRRLSDALAVLGERHLEDTAWLVTESRIYSRRKA